jgi:hypothetical protein
MIALHYFQVNFQCKHSRLFIASLERSAGKDARAPTFALQSFYFCGYP